MIPSSYILDLFRLDNHIEEKNRIFKLLLTPKNEYSLNLSMSEIEDMSRFDYEYYHYKLNELIVSKQNEEDKVDINGINSNYIE